MILAPHLVGTMKKAALGLPHKRDATERQIRDGMCWESEDELYNDGNAFKICCARPSRRDGHGDRRQLLRLLQEGSQNPDQLRGQPVRPVRGRARRRRDGLRDLRARPGFRSRADRQPQESFLSSKGWICSAIWRSASRRAMRSTGAIRRSTTFRKTPCSASARVAWLGSAAEESTQLTLRPTATYVLPSGFRVRLEKQQFGANWRLIGARPRGTLCHKPCTVSGGGKSEISKSIANALLNGPVFVRDYHRDMDEVAGDPEEGFLQHL